MAAAIPEKKKAGTLVLSGSQMIRGTNILSLTF